MNTDHCSSCSWEMLESVKYESIRLDDMQLPLVSGKSVPGMPPFKLEPFPLKLCLKSINKYKYHYIIG